jgi:probable F420-dependent oxidoreductase
VQLGVMFPQREIGADPIAVRDFVQAVEGLGYDYLTIHDHVLGADPAKHPGWDGAFDMSDMFHEPFALFGYLAAITSRIQLSTGVLILAQRQTALVAKQAAEIDVLSGGRLRLGVGTGWNSLEYEALGQNIHDRGARSEEQIAVLRALWTQESVDFHGKWHTINGAGLNPLPIQRPIPLWIGGWVERVMKRIGRLGDGWPGMGRWSPTKGEEIERVKTYAREAGRDSSKLGFEASVRLLTNNNLTAEQEAREWLRIGTTHIAINTMDVGLSSTDAHIKAIADFKVAMNG